MSEHEVTLREFLESRLNNFDTKLDEQKSTLNDIHEQTIKTNGRVGLLEQSNKALWWVVGVCGSVLIVVVLVLVAKGILTPGDLQ